MRPAIPSRILLTTDFSDNARCAYPYALGLSAHHGAALHVLHVITAFAEHEQVPGLQSYAENMERTARTSLEELELPAIEPVRISRELVGAPSVPSGIVAVAEERDADLIVMSSHGRRRVTQLLMGSTARSVIALSSRPVFCVTCREAGVLHAHGDQVEIARLLVPTDLSEESSRALDLAIEYAEHWDAEIHILSIASHEVVPVFFDPPVVSIYELDRTIRRRIADRLERYVERARSRGVAVQATLEEGATARAIARYAGDRRTDMIIMHRGRVGEPGHHPGCVTDCLLHDAPCPMLVV
ncbi:MAG: universal stress protein [Candidatus Eiseniibacteriota bacterium]|jgi:nucleotide-binding universal stress UspA family protein